MSLWFCSVASADHARISSVKITNTNLTIKLVFGELSTFYLELCLRHKVNTDKW